MPSVPPAGPFHDVARPIYSAQKGPEFPEMPALGGIKKDAKPITVTSVFVPPAPRPQFSETGTTRMPATIAASAAFLGNLLYANLFGGWDGFGGLERNMLEAAASVPLSVPLAAAGFGLRRLWTQLMTGHRPV